MNLFKLLSTDEISAAEKLSFIKGRIRTAIEAFSRGNSGIKDSTIIEHRYQGYKFYYEITGLRAELLKSPDFTYDVEVTNAIAGKLSGCKSPCFLDIGSHAGFMSVNILSRIPDVRIYAFEPGQFQASLFRKTIAANSLESIITLYESALGSEAGEAHFYCQEHPDADWSMSNGFFNTGRGKGQQKTVTVKVNTLDDWWASESEPSIDVVKMDTEGAELLILKGGTRFIHAVRPIVFLEIFPLNLSSYPYTARDILQWFNEQEYVLSTLSGLALNHDNLIKSLSGNEIFVATPAR